MSSPDIGLANWFLQRALRTPERAALAFESKTWSYAQMQQRIEQLAGRGRRSCNAEDGSDGLTRNAP